MEEFRQQILDESVLRLINLGQINKDDFEIKDNFIFIGEDCRKLPVKTILDNLNNEVTFDRIKKLIVISLKLNPIICRLFAL